MEIGELWISRCRLSTKEQAKENGDSAKVQIGRMRKAAKVERIEERIRGRRAAARKEEKGKKRVAKEIPRTCWTCGKTGHIAAWCRKGGNNKLYAVDEDDGENAEESTENEEDLQAWCLLEESENEQWQEVISKQSKRRVKKDNQASPLSIENSHHSKSEEDCGGERQAGESQSRHGFWSCGPRDAGKRCFHVKLERKTTPKKFVAANGERIKDLGEKTIPFKTNDRGA